MEQQVKLLNASGLHARPASIFVTEASKFQSHVFIEVNGRRVNAKSILGLLTLAIGQGSTITVITEGPDEEEALEALVNLVANGLGE